MPTRTAEAVWEGPVPAGSGTVTVESGALDSPYSFGSRFESGAGTNPEELLGAAHAGCFTMALALGLTEAGHPPARVHTTARVSVGRTGDGYRISGIDLRTEAEVPGLTAAEFEEHAQQAKAGCPVSKALVGTEVRLDAKLLG